MPNLNANDIKEIVHFIGNILLVIWGIKLIMCFIQEIFPKYCRHCGKKASGKI